MGKPKLGFAGGKSPENHAEFQCTGSEIFLKAAQPDNARALRAPPTKKGRPEGRPLIL
ncbi:MAG: hypothetical protein JSR72_16695 [Proteobacteria bacterium]|nr:hypothetical protein [Pseudomonadota bacterium]